MNKIDQALKDMKQSVPLVIKDKKDQSLTVPGKAGRPKLMTKDMQAKVIGLAEELFFIRSVAGEAGISTDTIERELRGRNDEDKACNKEFALLFLYAQNQFIAHHQRLMMQYATEKRTADWRAEAHILTLCDKEFSERKYLTDAVANQDAKILMLIKAEKLTLATNQGKDMLKGVKTVSNTPLQAEAISLLPFQDEDPKNKGKAKSKRPKNLK